MPFESRTAYTRSGGVHIAYGVSGGGSLDLLLVPDGMIPMEAIAEEPSFRRFVARLEGFARVIRFDRRGTGMSDPVSPSDPPTLEQWMQDAEAVLNAAGSETTALLGLAEGGFVVSLLAAARPRRVSALVLVHGSPGITAEPFRRWGLVAGAIERLAGTVQADWGDVGWGIPLFAPSAVDDPAYREWLERSVHHSLSPAMARAVFDVMFRSDIREILPAIQAPTLVVHRRDNRYVEPRQGRYLAEHIPDARYAELEGADHVPYLGDQDVLLDVVEEFLTGQPPVPAADRVLASVLFTDVVGSTQRLAEVGDRRWRDILLAMHDVARREVARYGGRVVDTAGDGIFATCDGPARTVHCAAALVRAGRPLGIELRAGVHTGECEIVGDKLGGLAVHIGARVAAKAGPGEVLVSSTVKDLVAGSGLRFVDRGLHRLKGVPDRWHLYAVDPETAGV